MAERRMFAKTIIDSDAFLEMPLSTQCLYFHLSMRADDDGFVNNPKKIQKMLGASEDDLKLLIAKSFILTFETGVIVIKHWRINNYIRNDRYHETAYQDEKSLLSVKENNAYTFNSDNVGIPCGNQAVYQMDTEVSIGKDSIDKDIKKESKKKESRNFVPPTLSEVKAYCQERNNGINPQAFIDFYESKGWMIGKNKVKDWKACVRTWENRRKEEKGGTNNDDILESFDPEKYDPLERYRVSKV